MSNELKGITGIDAAVNAIVHELEERKNNLVEEIGPLATIVTTEENLKIRKSDRATVNKIRGDFDKERIAIEKKWKAAIAPVSDAYKSAVAECDKVIGAIDKDLNGFEEKRLDAKRALIAVIYGSVEVPAEIVGWYTLEELYQKKWENAGTTEKQIRKEIMDAYAALKISYDTLKSLHHDWEAEGIAVLKETKDLQQAISKMNELSEQQRIINERMKADAARAEEERKAAEARKAEETEILPIIDKVPEHEEFAFGLPVEETVEALPFGKPMEDELFTEAERWLVSKVFQNYYCMGILDIAHEDSTAASLFRKIGLIEEV